MGLHIQVLLHLLGFHHCVDMIDSYDLETISNPYLILFRKEQKRSRQNLKMIN